MLGRLQLLFLIASLFLSWSRALLNPYKLSFEKRFNQTCSKYPFVQKYWSSIHQPKNKTVVFVFQEAGLNNCGLGDRLSGVLNAILLALRFDRTLLIKVRVMTHDPLSFHPCIVCSQTLISFVFNSLDGSLPMGFRNSFARTLIQAYHPCPMMMA